MRLSIMIEWQDNFIIIRIVACVLQYINSQSSVKKKNLPRLVWSHVLNFDSCVPLGWIRRRIPDFFHSMADGIIVSPLEKSKDEKADNVDSLPKTLEILWTNQGVWHVLF